MYKVTESDSGMKIVYVKTPVPLDRLVGWLKEHFIFFNTSLPKHAHIGDWWDVFKFDLEWTDKDNGLAEIDAAFTNNIHIKAVFKFSGEYPFIEQNSPIEMEVRLGPKIRSSGERQVFADSYNAEWAGDFKDILGLAECSLIERKGWVFVHAVLEKENCDRAVELSTAFELGLYIGKEGDRLREKIYSSGK